MIGAGRKQEEDKYEKQIFLEERIKKGNFEILGAVNGATTFNRMSKCRQKVTNRASNIQQNDRQPNGTQKNKNDQDDTQDDINQNDNQINQLIKMTIRVIN